MEFTKVKVIILAAGQGSRLLPLTQNTPKALLDIHGQTLIGRQIDAFAACGVRDFVVVTGFRPDLMDDALARIAARNKVEIRTVYNPFYAVADNLASCWMARHEMTGDFIQVNGDNVFRADLARRLLRANDAPVIAAVARKGAYDADDMKVIMHDDRLLRIGKKLPARDVNAEALGFYVFRGEGAARYRDMLESMIREPEGLHQWFPAAIDRLASEMTIRTLDLSGLEWCEVDYPTDLALARELAARWDEEKHRPRLVHPTRGQG